ncbi:pentatricopeptide repeat-containing protein mitochondrial [Dorcoceras hygrometricum]|uniref:Pentatricopeptide repeat-containing protein mitochondrial n=1 Tax=Dorcoceras hygrometricum TaxID=472368 RepID=A0A2Z7BE46_9LAMI|nr:pentatricopeptide repeat-containing protein mitochondrial [Dorcoceras hygrometricum]
MASSLVSNTNQVHFASVLAMDNSEMVAMFEALVASGLNDFLGCMSDIFESALIEFYHNASVQDDKVVSTVQGKLVEISEEIFARTFQLMLSTSCKKRELKIEYRLLSDIVEKSITVKAGSFDAVTHERFLFMTVIFGVRRYISINDKIAVDSVEGLAGKSRVKKTPVKRATSKKRPAVAIEEQVVKKKRTLKVKAAPSKAKLELVSVALDAEPLQTVDLHLLMMSTPSLSKTVVEKQPVQRSAEKKKDADFGASEDLVLGKKNEGFLSTKPTDEELMSLDDLLMQISDDMMLPSVTAAEVTKIKFGLTVEIHEVQDTDWYYASLPKISAHDKGKKLLEADDVVKGNPAREMVQLICGDFSLPPDVSFNDLWTSMSRIISLQSKESRRLDDSHNKVLDKIKQLEKTILDAFYQQNQVFHRLITGIRQEAHNDTNVLSLGLKAVRTQTAILTTDQADAHKEAREQKAIIKDMDERLATLRSEQLDFRAQEQENYNNLSSQLGDLLPILIVVMIKRGKKVAAADLNRLPMIKIDPVGVMQTEEVVEAVLVEVAEEMIERALQRKGDLVAVVLVDRIKER